MTTLAVRLVAGQIRGVANRGTELDFRVPPRPDVRRAFLAAYRRFADACRAVDEPGLALVAVDEATRKPCGIVQIRAQVGRHVVAMVGRHDRCDLFLDARDTLSLRQLVVVVDPVRSFRPGASVTYRVLDLRSRDGFTDEAGRGLRGVHVDGPAILCCAGFVVLALPLGDPTDWPADAEDAWAMLPERVYAGERVHDHARCSLMIPAVGPRITGMAAGEHRVAGTLEIWGPGRRQGRIAVSDGALRDGLLIGRDTRCDGARGVEDVNLSRVHALLLELDGALLAIDTASTHGIALVGDPPQRVIRLPDRAELLLGTQTLLRWRRSA